MNPNDDPIIRSLPYIAATYMIAGSIMLGSCMYDMFKKPSLDYIAPSRIEMELDDINFDGKKDAVITIDGTQYLFENTEGKPSLVEYKKAIER